MAAVNPLSTLVASQRKKFADVKAKFIRHLSLSITKSDRICDMRENRLVEEILSPNFRQKLTRLIARKVADPMDVDEIVQDTLLSALDSLPGFKGQSQLFTWVGGIARHEIVDFYRRKKIKQIVFSKLPFLEKLVSQALGPELAYQELETKTKILATLKRLSEGYAQILRLKYVEELSMRQIANQLNLTVKAVESRLTRARLAFQKVYVDQENRQVRFAPFA